MPFLKTLWNGRMAYCTIADLLSVESRKTLAELSNETQPTVIDENLVNSIIDNNSVIIDGFVRGRYPLEKVVADPVLKKICMELTIFDLYFRRSKSKIPENVIKSQERQYANLKAIQRAELVLEIDDTDLRPIHMAVSSPTQIFTSELMEQYLG